MSRADVQARTEELVGRLQHIEERFPDGADIEKYASVNDAILQTKIDSLRDSLSRVEGNQVMRAQVVLIVLGTNGTLVGLIAGVLALISSMKEPP